MLHRIIDSVSARHGAELRCLRSMPSRGRTAAQNDLLKRCAVPGGNRVHGAKLTGLQKLYIRHRPPVTGPYELQLSRTLAVCTKALLRSVAGTLRDLGVRCVIRLSYTDLIEVMPVVGPGLHHLKIKVVPYNPFHRQGSGRLEHTEELRAAVAQHCTALRSPAEVVAHREARR